MSFFNTFRGRLLLILAFLLIATLSVQFYLNYRTQQENNELREQQERTIVAGITLGINSITSSEYLEDLVKRQGQIFLDEEIAARLKEIIIIDNEWRVYDSLNPEHSPVTSNGNTTYKMLNELSGLPPLMEGSRLGEDLQYFPNLKVESSEDEKTGETHAIPIDTSKGRWHVMVVLESKRGEAAWRAAQPLIYTLSVLLLSTIITFLLVWRFTRPIANLSNAAREVAEGNLHVRVPSSHNDEMGELARNFNEMTSELEKKRELEQQLQQAEKSAVVGRLGSAIAHEIRNPLNYINLTLDHLRTKFAPDDAESSRIFDKLTSQIKLEVGRIDRQISDFLNYSRPTKANLQPIEARKVVEDSLRIVEAQAAEKNIKIGLVEHENVPKILGDAEFLRSVFNNLFINAVQSMETTGGNLGVIILPDNGFVGIEVSDTGNGIAEVNILKIFEPYFSTKETGTGLGLAIVQKIVNIHHGMIQVESNLGEGTRFTVKLPRAES